MFLSSLTVNDTFLYHLKPSMLPTLIKRCTPLAFLPAAACPQFLSLVAFRGPPTPAGDASRPALLPADRRRRGVRAFSRKRNIFLDPAERDDNMNSLAGLFDSSRFNDDDDEEQESGSSVGTMQREDEEEEEDEEEDETFVSTSASPAKLPPARNVKVRTAEFIKSSVEVKACPLARFPEFAVIGRSNVGKSSLINMLTGRNALAMVSKTPGKTRCINHFLINKSWYLVDLPGYGYAKTSKDNVLGWNKFTRDYFLERETLASVMLLVDASIPPQNLDVACANWLGEAEVPYSIVYTKVDKKKKGVPGAAENIAAFEAKLLESWEELPSAVATSSRSGSGKTELLSHIARLRALYNTNQSTVLKKIVT